MYQRHLVEYGTTKKYAKSSTSIYKSFVISSTRSSLQFGEKERNTTVKKIKKTICDRIPCSFFTAIMI